VKLGSFGFIPKQSRKESVKKEDGKKAKRLKTKDQKIHLPFSVLLFSFLPVH
jgi:hypothetical protein